VFPVSGKHVARAARVRIARKRVHAGRFCLNFCVYAPPQLTLELPVVDSLVEQLVQKAFVLYFSDQALL
jgi:hypothetical protein